MTFSRLSTLSIFLFFYHPNYGLNQENVSYTEIDNYLFEKHLMLNNKKVLNVLFSSNDCKMCYHYLHSILPKIKSDENLDINIVTDNVVFARKNFKKYNVKLNYFFDKDVFSKFNVDNKTIIYLKIKDNIITEIDEIFNNFNTNDEVILKVRDTLFSNEKISSTLMPFEKIFAFDNKMEVGVLFERLTDSKEFNYYKYIFPHLKDSLKLYHLKDRDIDYTKIKLVSFDKFQKISNENSLSYIDLKSFGSFEDYIFSTFSLNRLYEKIEDPEQLTYLKNTYLAVKKIERIDYSSNILDVSSYDIFYLIDFFSYNDKIYPVSVYTESDFKVLEKDKLKIKVNKLVEEKRQLEFGGEITFQLDKNENKTTAIELDESVSKYLLRNYIINTKDGTFQVIKEFSNQAENLGNLILLKTK